jgi:hypothetical protein
MSDIENILSLIALMGLGIVIVVATLIAYLKLTEEKQ